MHLKLWGCCSKCGTDRRPRCFLLLNCNRMRHVKCLLRLEWSFRIAVLHNTYTICMQNTPLKLCRYSEYMHIYIYIQYIYIYVHIMSDSWQLLGRVPNRTPCTMQPTPLSSSPVSFCETSRHAGAACLYSILTYSRRQEIGPNHNRTSTSNGNCCYILTHSPPHDCIAIPT